MDSAGKVSVRIQNPSRWPKWLPWKFSRRQLSFRKRYLSVNNALEAAGHREVPKQVHEKSPAVYPEACPRCFPIAKQIFHNSWFFCVHEKPASYFAFL